MISLCSCCYCFIVLLQKSVFFFHFLLLNSDIFYISIFPLIYTISINGTVFEIKLIVFVSIVDSHVRHKSLFSESTSYICARKRIFPSTIFSIFHSVCYQWWLTFKLLFCVYFYFCRTQFASHFLCRKNKIQKAFPSSPR